MQKLQVSVSGVVGRVVEEVVTINNFGEFSKI